MGDQIPEVRFVQTVAGPPTNLFLQCSYKNSEGQETTTQEREAQPQTTAGRHVPMQRPPRGGVHAAVTAIKRAMDGEGGP